MKETLKVLVTVGIAGGAFAVVGAIVAFFLSAEMVKAREAVRVLRVALERNPTPAQLGEASRLFPTQAGLNEGMKKSEYVRSAHAEEAKRAQRAEKTKGMGRAMAGVAVLLFVVALICNIVKNQPEPAPEGPLVTPSDANRIKG